MTELVGAKIDGLLPPNFFVDSENVSKNFLHRPPSVLKNHPLPPLKDEKNLPLGIKGDFLVLRGDGGGTFSLHF